MNKLQILGLEQVGKLAAEVEAELYAIPHKQLKEGETLNDHTRPLCMKMLAIKDWVEAIKKSNS